VVPRLGRPRKRLTELMAKSALEPPTAKQVEIRGKLVDKSWHLKVLRTPLEILPDSTGKRVGAVSLQVNEVPSSFFFVGQRSVHTFGKKKTILVERVNCQKVNQWPVAGSLNKRLVLSSSFRCDQIYK
jgi:hypothetical protein